MPGYYVQVYLVVFVDHHSWKQLKEEGKRRRKFR